MAEKPSFEIEKALLAKNKSLIIAGVDEVGRGCIAGPVVSAAVIFDDYEKLEKLNLFSEINDSKKLSPYKRQELFEEIKKVAFAYSIAEVSEAIIDETNILKASLRSMEKATLGLKIEPNYILIDGNQYTSLKIPQQTVVKGDSKSSTIAAASILAKVYRDKLMEDLDSKYPGYGFAIHKGYGTKEHLEVLKILGPCAIHRRTFKGVKEFFEDELTLF